MSSYINQLFFGIYPYIAIAVFVIGSLLRYEHVPYGWRSGSSQFLSKPKMRWASNLFHIGIIVILGGHLVGLLTPKEVYHIFITSSQKQVLAMTAGGIAGVACFIGLTMLIIRRFTDPLVKATSSFSDNLVLIILYIQLILGLMTIFISMGHLDGETMVDFGNWAQSIVTLNGKAASYVADKNIIFKLHIVLGLTILLIFPFTRLVHVWSVPISYITTRKGYQIVRKKEKSE
ncbi:MAG: respiratory nitrate reductase subunit gamma [Alphaproteobacteria bacterium]